MVACALLLLSIALADPLPVADSPPPPPPPPPTPPTSPPTPFDANLNVELRRNILAASCSSRFDLHGFACDGEDDDGVDRPYELRSVTVDVELFTIGL
jgi:hypothetical protein